MPTKKSVVKIEARPLSKKLTVEALLTAEPTSADTIAAVMGISRVAALSLINDIRRSGTAVVGSLQDGRMAYSITPPVRKAPPKKSFGKKARASSGAAA